MLSNLNKFVEYFYKFEMNFFSISLIFFFQLYLFTFIINKILKYMYFRIHYRYNINKNFIYIKLKS